MKDILYTVITGTGSYIPSRQISNEHFLNHEFYDREGNKLTRTNREIIDKFFDITTIKERRYVTPGQLTSDIAGYAAMKAIENAGIDPEDLDYIIVAHNFGDVKPEHGQMDMVPSIAARVKHKLEIKKPECVAYDLAFGCPGWLQGVIQANYYIKSGEAQKILVIGAEVLSRVSDPHDRDSMLYADGAGAVILEAKSSDTPVGILSHLARSDAYEYFNMLQMDRSYNKDYKNNATFFLKMNGRKLYQYALEKVPVAIKQCLDNSGVALSEVKKLLIHQANGKMDEAILKRLYSLYGAEAPENIMPMTIAWLGNTSVATLPTLFDLLLAGKIEGHKLHKGDTIVFASVGAGMNINAVVYRI